jgi:hypothetical protein
VIKIFVLALVALATSACTASIRTPYGIQQYVFWQRGIILQVTHTCTDKGRLYQAGEGLIAEIVGAEPRDIPLMPAMLGDQQIQVTLQSIDESNKAVQIFVETFHIDYYSTTAQTWIITNSRSGYWGGGGGGRRSWCSQ